MKKLLYCQGCGLSQVVKRGKKVQPCEVCQHVVFHAERRTPWEPFRLGCQSEFDRKFLRRMFIQSAEAEAIRKNRTVNP